METRKGTVEMAGIEAGWRTKGGGGRASERANVCPSELDFSSASVSLLATLWLNYLQSTSNIFKLNFMYAQSCIFPLFLRYETALRSTRALFEETGLFRFRITRADVHGRARSRQIVTSYNCSLLSHTERIRIDICRVQIRISDLIALRWCLAIF